MSRAKSMRARHQDVYHRARDSTSTSVTETDTTLDTTTTTSTSLSDAKGPGPIRTTTSSDGSVSPTSTKNKTPSINKTSSASALTSTTVSKSPPSLKSSSPARFQQASTIAASHGSTQTPSTTASESPTPALTLPASSVSTVTVTRNSSSTSSPLAQSTTAPATSKLSSRDEGIIIVLSVLVGILSFLWVVVLVRRCARKAKAQRLENKVDPVSFHAPLRPEGGLRNTDSFGAFASQQLDGAVDAKYRVPELDSHWERLGSLPSSPGTPTFSRARFSPVPDVFDSRWPGRHIPMNPSQRGSAFTADDTQFVLVSADPGLDSHQSQVGSAVPREESDSLSPVDATETQANPDEENEPGASTLKARKTQAGNPTWDGPPPEESERGDSSKTGPPAYSPGYRPDGSVPAMPQALVPPLPQLPPGIFGIRGSGWASP